MQTEITKAIPLLNERGNLTQAGYAKRLLPVYDRTKVKGGFARLKEWDYYYVGNTEFGVALTIADKSDVRRSRVRSKEDIYSDIHDRVNYAVTDARLDVFPEESQIMLSLDIDPQISSVMEYFEIFTKRMLLCRKAAQKLGCSFHLKINGQLVA